MAKETKPTSNAVEIMHRRYVKGKKRRLKYIERGLIEVLGELTESDFIGDILFEVENGGFEVENGGYE